MHPYSVGVVFDQDMYQGHVLAHLPTRISLVLVGAVLPQRRAPRESTYIADDMSWKSYCADLYDLLGWVGACSDVATLRCSISGLGVPLYVPIYQGSDLGCVVVAPLHCSDSYLSSGVGHYCQK